MTLPRTIPPDVSRVQIQAADPDVSAFVSANAGSGKTHVLAQRVINLLLRGVDPTKILCITFTKAASANMANRVFGSPNGPRSTTPRLTPRSSSRPARKPMRLNARGRAGCLPRRWRHRAGSKCRPSMPSARGCCISFRSRPMWQRVSPCWTKPPPRKPSIN